VRHVDLSATPAISRIRRPRRSISSIEDGAFAEIDIDVDIPNYRFAMFRFTAAPRP
jgi:hypothetical protein